MENGIACELLRGLQSDEGKLLLTSEDVQEAQCGSMNELTVIYLCSTNLYPVGNVNFLTTFRRPALLVVFRVSLDDLRTRKLRWLTVEGGRLLGAFALLEDPQTLEEVDVLRQRRLCAGHGVHLGGRSLRYSLRVSPVAWLALKRPIVRQTHNIDLLSASKQPSKLWM